MKIEFKDQVGIITGAASGLGQAIALNLSKKGVKLALFDRDTNGLQKTRNLLAGESEIYVLDITNEAEVAESINKVNDHFGRIDILVNKGYNKHQDIRFMQLNDGRHDVPTWAKAFPGFLKWGWGNG